MSDDLIHPSILGADVTDQETGTFDAISSAVRYGVPSALISGGLAIANTFLDYAGKDQIDVAETISQYSEQAGNYYADHQLGVDVGGFIATSLIPGSWGMKGLQIARAGNAAGTIGKALNFTASRKEHYLKAAIDEMAAAGGVVPKLATANRAKYFAWEFADQALMTAAAEAAIVATMHDGTLFSKDTAGDMAWNSAIGIAVGGTFGGVVGSLMGRGILKAGAEQVQARSRMVDTVVENLDQSLTKGTDTLNLAKQIVELPQAAGVIDDFKFKLDGKEVTHTINAQKALEGARDRALQTAENKLAIKFTELADGDAAVGQAYLGLIREGLDSARAAGRSGPELTATVTGYLANVNRVSSIDLDRYALDQSKFYINLEPKGEGIDFFRNLFSTERTLKTSKQAYRLAEDAKVENLVIESFETIGAKNLKEAYKFRPDVDMIQLPDGRLTVNPRSELIKRVSENPYRVRKYVNLETGTITPETIPHFADIVKKGDVRVTDNGIAAGTDRVFKQAASVRSELRTSPLEASARWAWASKLDWKQLMRITGGAIDTADLPLFARAAELRGSVSSKEFDKLIFTEGSDLLSPAEFTNMFEALNGYRRDVLMKQLAEFADNGIRPPSTQAIAAHLNTSVEFVDTLITQGFRLDAMPPELLGKFLRTETALLPKNVMVEWDFGVLSKRKDFTPEMAYNMNMGPGHLVTKELTLEYQRMIRSDVGMKAQELALGEHMANFMPAPDVKTSGVDAAGAGASTFGASNADYVQRAKLWVQDTGKAVALTTQRLRDEVIGMLAPSVNAIRDDLRASAELGAITTALRKSPHRFSLFDGPEGPVLISREVRKNMEVGKLDFEAAVTAANSVDGLQHSFPVRSSAVKEFLENNIKVNDTRRGKFTTLYNAAGVTTNIGRGGEIYVPPVNTRKYPYYAIVRSKEKLGLGSDSSIITARSEEQLRAMAAELEGDFDIFFKADTDAFHRALADYEYGMTLNEGAVNSALHRRGKLADVMPETRPENVLTDWLEWNAKQEEKLVRTSVQVGNRQFFSELQFLSDNYRTVSESQIRGLGAKLRSKIEDPFGDYIKTALNVSKQSEFPLLDSLNDFVDKIGVKVGEVLNIKKNQAMSGMLPWEEAEKVLKEYGLGTGMNAELYRLANEVPPDNAIRSLLAKGNMMLATVTLRFDFANSLVNMISTPILLGTEVSSLKRLLAGDSELAKAFQGTMELAGPNGARTPSTVKLLANGINNYFGPEKQALISRYKQIGAIKEVSQLYHEALDDLSFQVGKVSAFKEKLAAGTEKLATISGNNFSEELTRFISADVMRQISDPLVAAGKLTIKEQNAYISSFVNRVQGNYVTSQRPIVFQGTTGAAVSLFQTYAFNVLQQLTRHIENGDKRTLMMFAGLQGSIFGMNGLPFFDAINTHLIGSWLANNPHHNDAYNVLPSFNRELGNWALYGTASAFPFFGGQAPAVYTRGDINPRQVTILPTAVVDVPVVQAATRLLDTAGNFVKGIGGGEDVSSAFLRAMEHQGLNRPLAGMAQLLAGQSTTKNGALISAANEFDTSAKLMSAVDRVANYGGVPRLLGSRPLDEAVALNNLYRNKQYQALDRDRIERLGTVVKSKLANGTAPSQAEMEDFMLRYARSGGRIENFSASLQRWMRDANVSIINQTLKHVGSPYGIKMQQIMGGEGLQDYANRPSLEPDME